MLKIDDFHPYQVRAIQEAITMQQGCLFLGTGLGKTIISLTIYDQLRKRGLVESALVIAPKRVMDNVWRQEAAKWEHTKYYVISRIHGSETRGSVEYSRQYNFTRQAHIYLINYEAIGWLADQLLKTKRHKFQVIFYDESTKIKSTNTKRFKQFKKFMHTFGYRYALTGTPIPNGLQDIFGQMYTIDAGERLGQYVTKFRADFMQVKYQIHGRVNVYEEAPGSRELVARKIADKVIYLKKTEHLKLPPVEYIDIRLDMDPKLREMYDGFEQDMFLKFETTEVEAMSSASAAMKLRQFLQGKMYDGEGGIVNIHNHKLMELKKLLKTVTGNSLIAYNFRFERDPLKSITNNSPHLDQTTKGQEAENAIVGWNNYEFKTFLINPASAAFGLNLQAGGSNVIWYSLTYNFEHYSQLIDRLWRQGQRNTVRVYHLVFKDTIEDVVKKALQTKGINERGLKNELKKYGRAKY